MESRAFTVKIAGVPIGIRCRYASNERFFGDYLSDETPHFTVEPAEEDLIRIKASFDRTAEAEGREKTAYSRAFLENNALHELIADAMPAEGVLLMHGSALSMDGEGYIFTARSGTGKSTHARFWRETFGDRCVMINDDKPMLRVSDEGVTVFGTPWNGKHHLGGNTLAPLKAIISLSRSETNSIAPLSASDAFPVLLSQVYASRSAATMRRIIELEQRIVNGVRFYRLGCNLDPEAAVTAYNGIKADQNL